MTRHGSGRADDEPSRLGLARRRNLVARHTRLQPVPGVDGIRLHLADRLDATWRATEEALGSEAPIPFWAFAWAGGIALARYLAAQPHEVAGRRVMDFGTGSGLVAIAAARAGASHVAAVDVDPFAEAAVAMNARANGVRIAFDGADPLDEPLGAGTQVLLAADTWYDSRLAERALPWLRAAHGAGVRVLLADPGRRYLPTMPVIQLARDEVRTTTTLEDREVVPVTVFTFAD